MRAILHSPGRHASPILAAIVVLSVCLSVCGLAYGGGGPENYLLVVNLKSEASLTIANHFVSLRQIPTTNIVYVDWTGDKFSTDAETFRQQILVPALRAIEARSLTTHIDGIVYSSDFPYSIDFTGDVPAQPRGGAAAKGGLPQGATTPVGSLNGLTFYYQHVLARQGGFNDFRIPTNFYFRPVRANGQTAPTHGFRGWYGWGPNGELIESGGSRYMLSTILGLTVGKGNTVEEVVAYLRRSAEADGSSPDGTIYYAKTEDIRTKTRAEHFDLAVRELDALGVKAQVIAEYMPFAKDDVAGAMLGNAGLVWSQSNSTILKGAIVDSLTSFGAEMPKSQGHTLLTEFLAAGAAGSAGTPVEPLSIPHKFPNALVHVHYARGCTLAEAFYQSVAAPYQLVIAGDPLCRPWAKIPEIQVEGLAAGDTVKGMLSIRPTAELSGGRVDRFELFVDGQRVGRCGNGESLELDTTKHSDGHHELRVVGTDSGPIETQGRLILPAVFNNHDRTMTFTASARRIRAGQTVRLTANAPGVKEIWFDSNGKRLGRINGDYGELPVKIDKLGSGPVKLRAIGVGRDVASHVYAEPLTLEIMPAR